MSRVKTTIQHGASTAVATLALLVMAACGGGGGSAAPVGGATPQGTSPGGNLPQTSSVSGTVATAAGVPLAGVAVTAYLTNDHTWLSTTTDANGRYSFTGLLAGGGTPRYELWASRDGYGFAPAPKTAALQALRSDYWALYRTVISDVSQPGAAVTGADFVALDGSSGQVGLARSGQSASAAPGDDAAQARGVAWPSQRFVDNGDGSVRDALTGLVWLKQAGCLGSGVWADGVAAARTLASGQCGLSDGSRAGQWRMPNINELESLVDASRSAPALPAGHPFTGVPANVWSSTTYYGAASEAWMLRTADGRYLNDFSSNVKASSTGGFWAVRDGSAPGAVKLQATGQYKPYADGDDGDLKKGVPLTYARFIDKGDGTVVDTMTGLRWLRKADCVHAAWSDALAAVNALASGQCGLTDGSTAGQWRVPNRAELLSLADRTLGNHADDFVTTFRKLTDGSVDRPAIFDGMVTAEFYWTSTTDAAAPSSAWTVYSCDWGVYDTAKAQLGYTLAVR